MKKNYVSLRYLRAHACLCVQNLNAATPSVFTLVTTSHRLVLRPPFLARSAHLVASLTLAPAAADSTQHRPSSGRLIFSPTHVLYCCFSALCVCTCFVSIQHPALMVAARPAVVRYTPDHSHGPSRCQESDRPTSVVYALLIYYPPVTRRSAEVTQ